MSGLAYSVALGAASVITLMLALWLVHLPLQNASVVDPGWAAGLALMAGIYAATADGFLPRRVAIAVMAGIWGLRLALYLLFTRVVGHPEEGRYQELRRRWKTNLPVKFLAFFEMQALTCIVLSVPFLLITRNTNPQFVPLELAGMGIWAVAFVGELVSDAQLNAFKKNPSNHGKTCRAGLWHYSRHPNYFFEWLIWVGYAVFACASPYGYVSILCPALMLYFLFRVTGIPATEEQALRTKGDDYRTYQRTTSAFVPWFPRAL